MFDTSSSIICPIIFQWNRRKKRFARSSSWAQDRKLKTFKGVKGTCLTQFVEKYPESWTISIGLHHVAPPKFEG